MTTKKVVLVTAASKGIGRAVATHLSQQGWSVVAFSRSEAVQELAREIDGVAVQGSITKPADLERLVQTALDRFGRIDALVNNTGHPAKGDVLKLGDEAWQEGFDLVLQSVIRLARLVVPQMIERRSGAIVNISSYAARKPEPDRPVSSVMRAALSSWTRVLAEHCAPHGIRVNAIAPGFVDSYPVSQEIIDTIPLGRIGTLEELASAVSFLLSDQSSYITGQTILLDGGMVRTI